MAALASVPDDVPGPGDRIYTEADVADMRDRWDRLSKEREWSTAIANLTGQVSAMPELIRSISSEVSAKVVADVLQNQRDESSKRFGTRWDRWAVAFQLTLITAGLVYEIFIKHTGP